MLSMLRLLGTVGSSMRVRLLSHDHQKDKQLGSPKLALTAVILWFYLLSFERVRSTKETNECWPLLKTTGYFQKVSMTWEAGYLTFLHQKASPTFCNTVEMV